jgi:hypothetical protein
VIERFLVLGLAGICLLASAGCSHEITGTRAAAGWPAKGACLTAARDLKVMRKGKGDLLYASPQPVFDEQPVGVIRAGTTVTVTRVMHYSELVAFMVLPVTYEWNTVLARVSEGEMAGKEVAVMGTGVYFMTRRGETGVVPDWKPCEGEE